jgi:RNA polymerase sigma-70 factor (ECF subfamily)
MSDHHTETEELVRLASGGDKSAERRLMGRHRGRLRRMVAVHLDQRLVARVDPSDVVQETLMIAYGRLPGYLQQQPIPFYPWLRQIAWNRLLDLHRTHVKASKRTVTREEDWEMALSEHSANQLAQRLMARGLSPSEGAMREELRCRIQVALARLPAVYREVLVMRQLERLSITEIAAALGIAEGTVKSRHFRALEKIRVLLNDEQ